MMWQAFVLLVCVLSAAVSDDTAPNLDKTSTTTTPAPFSPSPPENASPCSDMPLAGMSGPDLPDLPTQFEAHVEAKINQVGAEAYTMDIVEFYDDTKKMGAMHRTLNGQKAIWIYNFATSESFQIDGNVCATTNMDDEDGSTFNFFNFTLGKTGGSIGGASDFFSFGTMFNETFVSDNETIRGMSVNHWASCVEWSNMIFRLDYYFSKPDYQMGTGQAALPVRAIMNGTMKNQQRTDQVNFEHIYDFTCFTPGAVDDCTVFEVPQGTVCKRLSKEGVTPASRPKLAERFSMTTEVIWPHSKTVTVTKQYFDYQRSLCRLDYTPAGEEVSQLEPLYGQHPLTFVLDFKTGLQYVMDRELLNCSIGLIEDTIFGISTNTTMQMKHGDDMFNLDHLDLAPQGTRNIRGIDTDVWAAQYEDNTYEFYFAQEGWYSGNELSAADVDRALVGMWVRSGQDDTKDYINHVVDYLNQAPLLSAFDVDMCFRASNEMKHFRIQVEGTYDDVVSGLRQFVQPAVQMAVAHEAGIDTIRISRLEFIQVEDNAVDIWMTMLGLPSDDIGTLPTSVAIVPLDIAYDSLKSSIEGSDPLVIKVVIGSDTKYLNVIKDSLKTDREVMDPRIPPPPPSGGHSSASMGALAFFMLIIGAGCGMLAGFFLWKRNTGIPYMVQH